MRIAASLRATTWNWSAPRSRPGREWAGGACAQLFDAGGRQSNLEKLALTMPRSRQNVASIMMVFLIHVRDPQFYALPARTRAKNGNIRVMGFPPIGIMSLSAVLKRAGHECVMFDQANPETPNEAIIDEIRRQRPELVGLSFLSTTSYPYAKILARQI